MVKRCCYGTCNSDTRYVDREEGAIVFFPFPKPLSDIEKCHRWIRLCGRPHEQLNLKILQERSKAKHIYVCSKHFIDGKPTTANPDPEPASRYEKVTPARRPPKPRAHSEPPKKKIRTALSETFSHSQNQDVVIVHPTVSAFMSEQEDAFHGDCTNSNAQNNEGNPLEMLALAAENETIKKHLAGLILQNTELKRKVANAEQKSKELREDNKKPKLMSAAKIRENVKKMNLCIIQDLQPNNLKLFITF